MNRSDAKMRQVASTVLPTRWGRFQAIGFERRHETAVALILGDPSQGVPLVRIHSQCFTGDVLGSERCDCGQQLDLAMRAITREGRGLLIYEQQEGRGIGLMSKLRAYALQDQGLDTIEANHALGYRADCRDFRLPVDILMELGIRRVRLLSNNPDKVRAPGQRVHRGCRADSVRGPAQSSRYGVPANQEGKDGACTRVGLEIGPRYERLVRRRMARDVVVTSGNSRFLQEISIGPHRIQADEPVDAGEATKGLIRTDSSFRP